MAQRALFRLRAPGARRILPMLACAFMLLPAAGAFGRHIRAVI